MIQRIQSLYLVLVIAMGVSLFFIPFATVNYITDVSSFKVMHLMHVSEYENNVVKTSKTIYIPSIITTFIIAVALITIFVFKNRKLQILLCKLMMLLLAILIALIFYEADLLTGNSNQTTKPIYLAGTYLPVTALVLVYMAFKAIMKDDELVKSADRLR